MYTCPPKAYYVTVNGDAITDKEVFRIWYCEVGKYWQIDRFSKDLALYLYFSYGATLAEAFGKAGTIF